jgi:hypothetical protein
VGAEAVPGQLQHLQHVPLGDGLLDPAGQDRGGPLGRPAAAPLPGDGPGRERLVGGQQRDAALFQFVFDLGAEVGPASDPFDRLAHHRDEPAVGPGGFGQQIRDAAVAGDRDGEPLVRVTAAAI